MSWGTLALEHGGRQLHLQQDATQEGCQGRHMSSTKLPCAELANKYDLCETFNLPVLLVLVILLLTKIA